MTRLISRLELLEGLQPARPVRWFAGYENEDCYHDGEQCFTYAELMALESQGVDVNLIEIAYEDRILKDTQHD